LFVSGRGQSLFCDQDVRTIVKMGALLSENCAQSTFRSATNNSITYFFTGCKAISFDSLFREIEKNNRARMLTLTSSIDKLKLAIFFENRKTVYTVRDFLPFARRRLSTRRPFFVAIRARKP